MRREGALEGLLPVLGRSGPVNDSGEVETALSGSNSVQFD